jgi:hypothetical protein
MVRAREEERLLVPFPLRERERRKGDPQRFEIAMDGRDPDGVEVPLSPLSLFAVPALEVPLFLLSLFPSGVPQRPP